MASQLQIEKAIVGSKAVKDFQVNRGDAEMFSGKNNHVLDNVYFRVLLQTAGFAVWLAASYLALALS